MLRSGVTNLKERAVLDDDVVHVEVLKVGEVSGEGDEVGGGVRAMELDEVRLVRVRVASPTEFGESLLEFGVGTDDLVAREVDEDPWSGTGSGGCARVGWLLLLEGLPCWVGYEPSHSVLAENPHTRHCH